MTSIDTWQGGRQSHYVQCVLANNSSPMTSYGTNTWVLSHPDDSTCVVIDPGPADAEHLERIIAACQTEGGDVAAIILTHDHDDHSAAAPALAELTGAAVLSRNGGTLPEGPIKIEGTRLKLEAVSLPGHSSDSVGILLEEDRAFFTGDVIFARTPTLICWPDGSLAQYLDSLRKMSALVTERGIERLLTGHGFVIDDPLERIAACRRHRVRRLNQVISAVKTGIPAQADQLVDAVYNDTDPRLREAAKLSINAQLRYAFDTGLLQEPHRRKNNPY